MFILSFFPSDLYQHPHGSPVSWSKCCPCLENVINRHITASRNHIMELIRVIASFIDADTTFLFGHGGSSIKSRVFSISLTLRSDHGHQSAMAMRTNLPNTLVAPLLIHRKQLGRLYGVEQITLVRILEHEAHVDHFADYLQPLFAMPLIRFSWLLKPETRR